MSIDAVDTSSVTALHQVYQTSGCSPTRRAEAAEPAEASAEDSVTLSSEGQNLLHLSSLFGTEPGEPITLDDINAYAARQLTSFNKQFNALLRENGIDTSQPITLGHEYGTGRVVVTNDHPQAEKIDALLADNFDLCNTYTGATNALELARHGREHSQFAQAYAQDPQMAVAQYAYLFNTRWQAAVTFSDGGYDVAYNRVARY